MSRSTLATPAIHPSLFAFLNRHGVATTDELADVPAVGLQGSEIVALADAVDLPLASVRTQFRMLGEQGFLGRSAALFIESPETAFIGDWARGRIYALELDFYSTPPTDSAWACVEGAIVAEWLELRSGWASEGHLSDPELAAALRAYTQVLQRVLRLRRTQFGVGGQMIECEL